MSVLSCFFWCILFSQANGLDERFNQTLQNMLVKYVSSKKTQWSTYLDTCVFAYNTSRHASSRYPPFMLMFGRRAVLPIDVELQDNSASDKCRNFFDLDDPDVSLLLSERQHLMEDAKRNIIMAQEKQKEQYDKKHSAAPGLFSVDQLVLKKDFNRRKTKGGKLKERFVGPFTITKVLPHGIYQLRGQAGQVIRATGGHLKVYRQAMEGEDCAASSSSYGACLVIDTGVYTNA